MDLRKADDFTLIVPLICPLFSPQTSFRSGVSTRNVPIAGEHYNMLLLFPLCLRKPWGLFRITHLSPDLPDDARNISMVVLDGLWQLFLVDKVAAEDNKGVSRAWNVSWGLFARV